MKLVRDNKGKSLLIAGIILMWLLLGILFKNYGYGETWELWGVPVHTPMFRDFMLIPGSAESFRHGFEPSVENPYDVGGRIFNYPAFWRLFFYTNISADDTVWIVVTLLVLYFVSVMVFPEKLTVPGAFLMLLVVFSPASMLLYERGNADLFVFPLCVLVILASSYSANITAMALVFASIVKMFPFFGITVLLKESRQNFWRLFIACVTTMIIYGALTFSSQSAAWNTTMRGDGLSYGTFVLITRLGGYIQSILLVSFFQLELIFETLGILLILLAVVVAVRGSTNLESSSERNLAAFRMGASIFVGTFLLGNNWDYRLAFLVLVIPQLSEWLSSRLRKTKIIIWSTLGLLLFACWSLKLGIDPSILPLKDPANRIVVFDEFMNWLLLPGLAYLLAASFPTWLKMDLQKIVGSSIKS